jgi:hypothetical protein
VDQTGFSGEGAAIHEAFAKAMMATPVSQRSMSEFGRFPQREQERQYRNENEYNRRLAVHHTPLRTRDGKRQYQKQPRGSIQ